MFRFLRAFVPVAIVGLSLWLAFFFGTKIRHHRHPELAPTCCRCCECGANCTCPGCKCCKE